MLKSGRWGKVSGNVLGVILGLSTFTGGRTAGRFGWFGCFGWFGRFGRVMGSFGRFAGRFGR
jgi:hypothetical protein